jgi:peptidyl-tRNA hydrolase
VTPGGGAVDRLYLVTRRDLPAGQQAAQVCHALRQFVEDHPAVERAWFSGSSHLVLLAVADEAELSRLLEHARDRGLRVAPFHEPDRGGELTAAAMEPRARSLLRGLPLALAHVE